MRLSLLIVCFCCTLTLLEAQWFTAQSYPSDYHGTPMSGGQRYSKFLNSAANNNIALGSKVLLTEKSTSRSVVVTINDRIEEASVDFLLSDQVYKSFGLEPSIKLSVRYKLLDGPSDKLLSSDSEIESTSKYEDSRSHELFEVKKIDLDVWSFSVQIGSFSSLISAMRFIENYQDKLELALMIESYVLNDREVFRVYSGRFTDQKTALDYSRQIANSTDLHGFVKKLK